MLAGMHPFTLVILSETKDLDVKPADA